MKSALAVAGGLLAGAALAGIGIALAPDGAALGPTTTTPTTAPTVWWVDPRETPLGPAVVILDDLEVVGDEAVLTYRVVSRAPVYPGLRFDEPVRDVAPETWTLTTTDGTHRGTSTSTGTVVRFTVGEGFSLDRVTGLTIDGYRIRIPYSYEIGLPAEPEALVALTDGATVMLVWVLEQASSVIVQVRASEEHDDFVSDSDTLRVTGAGPEWRASMFSTTGDRQLLYEGSLLPDPIPLLVQSTTWIPVPGPITVDIGGL